MCAENNSPNAEEVIFYIDLVSDILKKKHVLKGIKEFITGKEKLKLPNPTVYGLILFQAEQNLITNYGIDNFEKINEILNESWDSREITQSYLENGLFEIFSYIFWKTRTTKKSYTVIILSDKASELPEDYYNAVYGLILKAKKFSTCINIIRVGKNDDESDTVKLKIISSETQGGVFYCQDDKHMSSVLESLVQSKEEFKIVREEDQEDVLEVDKSFYEHLAVDLISLDSDDEETCSMCNQEKCPICQAYSDEINKCFNCNTKFHGCCATKYAMSNNIGFKHIFRCPQCSTLLKLDEEFVDMVDSEDRGEDNFYTIEEVEEESVALENVREELTEDGSTTEDDTAVEETLTEEPITVEVDAPEILAEGDEVQDGDTKKVRIGGFFGKEVEIKTGGSQPSKNGNGPAPVKVVESKVMDVKTSITALKPPRKRKSIKLCVICGATVKTLVCPNCGADVQ